MPLLRQLRQLFWISLLLFSLLAALLPPLFGIRLRAGVDSVLNYANATALPLQIEVVDQRKGWFSSDYQLTLAAGEETVPVLLSILHGPVFWHLRATPLGLADLKLEPDPAVAPERHLSASGMLTLEGLSRMSFRAIGGFSTRYGEHWLEAHLRWPVFAGSATSGSDTVAAWPAAPTLDLWVDVDALALTAGPYASLLNELHAERLLRVSAGRVLGHVRLHQGELTLNGQALPQP